MSNSRLSRRTRGIFALIVLGIIVLVVLIGVSSAIRIINEYERGSSFGLAA